MTQGLGIDCVHCSRNGDEKGEWSWRGLYVGAHILMNRQQLFKKYTTSWQGLPALLCIAVKRSPQCLCNKRTKSVIKQWTIWGNCSVFVEVWCSRYYTQLYVHKCSTTVSLWSVGIDESNQQMWQVLKQVKQSLRKKLDRYSRSSSKPLGGMSDNSEHYLA